MRIIHSTPRHSTVSEPEPPKLIPAPLAPSSVSDMEIPGLSPLVPFPHIPDYLNHQPWGRDDSDNDADGESEDEWDVVVEPPQLGNESFKPDGMISEKEEYDPVFSAHLDPSLLLLSRPSTPPFSPSLASNSPPAYPPNSPSPTSSSPSPPDTTTTSRSHRTFIAARRHRRIIPIPTDNMMTPVSKKRLALALRRPSPGSLRKHELFQPEVMSLFNPRNPRTTGTATPVGPLSNENAHMDVGTNISSMMMTPPLIGNPWSLGLGLGGGDEGQRGFVEGDKSRDEKTPPSPRPLFPHSPPVEPIDYTAWEQEILGDLPGVVMGSGEVGEVNVSPSWLD